jgi:hypothetical protein
LRRRGNSWRHNRYSAARISIPPFSDVPFFTYFYVFLFCFLRVSGFLFYVRLIGFAWLICRPRIAYFFMTFFLVRFCFDFIFLVFPDAFGRPPGCFWLIGQSERIARPPTPPMNHPLTGAGVKTEPPVNFREALSCEALIHRGAGGAGGGSRAVRLLSCEAPELWGSRAVKL